MITTIDRVCQQCGKHFLTPAWRVRQGKGKLCSVKCFNQFQIGKAWLRPEIQSEAQKNSYRRNPERSINNLKIMKQLWQDPEFRKKVLEARNSPEVKRKQSEGNSRVSRRMWQNTQFRTRIIESHKQACQDPAYKAKLSERLKKLWQNPEWRAKMLKAHQGIMKKRWQDPEWVAKRLATLNRKPTKLEQQLQFILDKHFPQFKYNGDFSLGITLAGHIPDFVNVNGRKEVIEVFGDYWHSPEIIGNDWKRGELGKVMLYNSVGYCCLVIWEHDLKTKSESEIIDTVGNFIKSRR